MGRQLLPLLLQLIQVGLDVGLEDIHAQLIGLGEDQSKRHSVLTQPLDEVQVDSLRSMTTVDEHKQASHLLTLQHV